MMKKRESDLLKNIIKAIAISLFLLSFMIACESEKEIQKAEPVKVAPAVKKKEPEEVKKEETPQVTYVYDPEGKRDPFKTFIKKPKVTIVKTTVPLTPLQEYEITQLKLIGIISGIKENRAMVSDPTGKGYILKKGTLIGKNFGRVDRIEKNAVIIIEDVQDFLGNIITKEIPLTLETEGGE